jgi:hypothetical protein
MNWKTILCIVVGAMVLLTGSYFYLALFLVCLALSAFINSLLKAFSTAGNTAYLTLLPKLVEKQPVPPPVKKRAAKDSILSPWGWPAHRPARKSSQPTLAPKRPALAQSGKSDMRGFVKPWGW